MKPYTLETRGYNTDTTYATGNYNLDIYQEHDNTYIQDTAYSYEYLQCPRCGTLNWGWYRHCLQCGARLITEPEPTLQDIMKLLKKILKEIETLNKD